MNKTINSLGELQREYPLKPHWLKQDYVSDIEALFIYYNIEPIDQNQLIGHMEGFFEVFDVEGLRPIMKRSDIPFVQWRGIPLKEFVQFLIDKQIPVPAHLKNLTKDQFQVDLEEKPSGEILVEALDLKGMRPVQLQRLFARTYAAIKWKEAEIKLSANALVETKEFQAAMRLAGADSIASDTHAEWISDLSPYAKKKK